jgi:hypothetical protein
MVYKQNDEKTDEEQKVIRGFKWVPVFDIASTDGEDLPTVCHKLSGDDPAGIFARLIEFASSIDFTIEDAELPECLARIAKAAANCVPIPLEEPSGCDRLRRGRAACRRVARRLPTCRRNARPRASTTGAFIFWRAFVLFPRTVLLNCRFFQWLDYQP